MVKWGALCLALCLVPALASAAQASPPDLAPLPSRPSPSLLEKPNPIEEFAAVTLVSLPFATFWSLLGALAVASVSQGHFPPAIDTPMLAGAGAVAASVSLGVGLVSIHWGGPSPKKAPLP